ncbi:MAG: hypothetical protein VYC19_08275 [Pseudomonadota bacterium]|nr:hypothetical protein [Pseudomonadota bacterium]MEC7702739.1 hypothetical protein [Pseudomonadota bacterium]
MQDQQRFEYQGRTRKEIGTEWDPARLTKPHLPVILDRIVNRTPFDQAVTLTSQFSNATIPQGVHVAPTVADESFLGADGLYIEDLPIKFPKTDYQIPQIIWDNYGDLLKREIELERMINPHLDDQYIYLTIQQSIVKKDDTHRPSGVHIDGFQKPIIIPQPVQHQISICNMLPTKFYAAPLTVDPATLKKKEIFNALAQQCQGVTPYHPPAYTLHLLNAYCPHEPDTAPADGFRTFVRFSASSIPFMGQDNTRNPLFTYNWDDQSKKAFYDKITKPQYRQP